ncbi:MULTISPECIES: MarR family winged helix-turn-helix transcriptional regulator [Bacillus]|uniref:MarR family winged helix-turn-helix transcriptional regulator n=1 Tax=Bacillus TaxID=1386 RepID=UPI00030001F5|nr:MULTISPECIES: MarR family transcriptional regulator [Bacillus]
MLQDITVEMVMDIYNDLSKKMADQRFKVFVEHLKKHELTMNQYNILTIVQGNKGTSASHLAEKLNLKAASITYLVDSLEKRGLLVRKENPEDRRSHLIEVTAEGASVISMEENYHLAYEFFSKLEQDDIEMVYMLLRILKRKLPSDL